MSDYGLELKKKEQCTALQMKGELSSRPICRVIWLQMKGRPSPPEHGQVLLLLRQRRMSAVALSVLHLSVLLEGEEWNMDQLTKIKNKTRANQTSDWCFIFTLSQLLPESVSEEVLSSWTLWAAGEEEEERRVKTGCIHTRSQCMYWVFLLFFSKRLWGPMLNH